jgi:hypothetical protein
MHVYGARGPLSDTPQLGEYEVVLAWEAKAAIAAAEQQAKPTPPPLPPSVGVPEKRWFR